MKQAIIDRNLFAAEFESIAIERIKKFHKIAQAYGFEIALGFSGGKDSQVVYHLCKRAGIPFTAYYNVAFESPITKNFIKQYYPETVWRKDHPFGFINNIMINHKGMLPTIEKAYCCQDYKHNPKYVDKCSITGVRRQESAKRANRTIISVRSKKVLRNIPTYFQEHCQSVGTKSVIQLNPIIDWSNDDVWNYIYKYDLPINPEYDNTDRVGCIVCPKTNFSRNVLSLYKYPGLIDSFIIVRLKGNPYCNWFITNDNKDYSDDKLYYICRWLNRSFRKFSKKQQKEYEAFKRVYERYKNEIGENNNKRSEI